MTVKQAFINGNVLTMAPKRPQAAAFSLIGDRFFSVGSNEEARAGLGPETEIVDLAGKTVVPGFIETHNHLSWFSIRSLEVDCSTFENRTIEEVKDRIKEKVEASGPGEWVMGHSFDDTLIADNRHLTRTDLDEVSPQNPVFVSHACGHLGYANSLALEKAGIGPQTPQPAGGEIHKDENGAPTGLLMEPAAITPVVTLIPRKLGLPELKELLQKAVKHVNRAGVTSIHDAAIGVFFYGPEFIRSYRELADEGRLDLRVYMTVLEQMYKSLPGLGLGTGFGSEYVKLGCVKLLQDGSIQGWTGALSEPYYDRPDFKGHLIMPQEELDALVEKYHQAGLQIAVHANGDAAIESVIQAFERAQRLHPRQDHRHMIIHCQTASPDHIRRMKSLGLVPSYFVNHVYYWGDRHASIFLGPERAARISPLASSLKEGLIFTLHSDLPITPIDPLSSIHNAVNRVTREGKVLGEGERISPLEALKTYTTHAAYTSFEEGIKGSIEPGKLADFVVLSDDPLTFPPERINEIQVLETVVGGKKVFDSD